MKKKDPFDFDDIYRQAGVEDLFVKKAMVGVKKVPVPGLPVSLQQPSVGSSSQASQGMGRSAAPAKPSQPLRAPASSDMDFDFFSSPSPAAMRSEAQRTGSGSSTATATTAKQSADRYQASVQATSSRGGAVHASVSDDPFAAFESIEGAAPVVSVSARAPPLVFP
ncbi:MAG: hypothetical protein WDW36_001557 [Sanguina aurantia]